MFGEFYLLDGGVGGVWELTKCGLVGRFHAWQSALLFTAIFILHLVFSWSSFFGWLFFLCDLALIAFLTMRAYRDADMLDRFEVPFFGQIANRILNDE